MAGQFPGMFGLPFLGGVPLPAIVPPMPLVSPSIAPPIGVPLPLAAPAMSGNAVISAAPQLTGQASKVDGASIWMEHKSADGRSFFHNRQTGVSTWEKPEELKSPAEILMDKSAWKEFFTPEKRPYYYNKETQQTVWDKPPEYVELERRIAEQSKPAAPVSTSGTNSALDEAMKATLASLQQPVVNDSSRAVSGVTGNDDDRSEGSVDSTPDAGNSAQRNANAAVKTEFRSKKEQAEALRALLAEKNVPSTATWESAVKLLQKDPRFAALRTFTEKKQAFNAYKVQRAKDEREEARARARRAGEDLRRLLLESGRVTSLTRFEKADALFGNDPVWRAVKEKERREIFTDAQTELAEREYEEARALRKRNVAVFAEILGGMSDVAHSTLWSELQGMLLANARFVEDEDLQNMDKEDALACFEEHIRELERQYKESREAEQRDRRRVERWNREAFQNLLDELKANGSLTRKSTWKQLYAVIRDDNRLLDLASSGQPGSTPIDLFKFAVEDLAVRYRADKKLVESIFKENKFDLMSVHGGMRAELVKIVSEDERAKSLSSATVHEIIDELIEQAEKDGEIPSAGEGSPEKKVTREKEKDKEKEKEKEKERRRSRERDADPDKERAAHSKKTSKPDKSEDKSKSRKRTDEKSDSDEEPNDSDAKRKRRDADSKSSKKRPKRDDADRRRKRSASREPDSAKDDSAASDDSSKRRQRKKDSKRKRKRPARESDDGNESSEPEEGEASSDAGSAASAAKKTKPSASDSPSEDADVQQPDDTDEESSKRADKSKQSRKHSHSHKHKRRK